MSRNSARTPRKQFTLKCEYEGCAKEFTAFRVTARFHSPKCRAAAYNAERDRNGREATIQRLGKKCVQCGTDDQERTYFTRNDPRRDGERVVLCGGCNSKLSRELFYKRVPEPGRGYARKVYLTKKIADENGSSL